MYNISLELLQKNNKEESVLSWSYNISFWYFSEFSTDNCNLIIPLLANSVKKKNTKKVFRTAP